MPLLSGGMGMTFVLVSSSSLIWGLPSMHKRNKKAPRRSLPSQSKLINKTRNSQLLNRKEVDHSDVTYSLGIQERKASSKDSTS